MITLLSMCTSVVLIVYSLVSDSTSYIKSTKDKHEEKLIEQSKKIEELTKEIDFLKKKIDHDGTEKSRNFIKTDPLNEAKPRNTLKKD